MNIKKRKIINSMTFIKFQRGAPIFITQSWVSLYITQSWVPEIFLLNIWLKLSLLRILKCENFLNTLLLRVTTLGATLYHLELVATTQRFPRYEYKNTKTY